MLSIKSPNELYIFVRLVITESNPYHYKNYSSSVSVTPKSISEKILIDEHRISYNDSPTFSLKINPAMQKAKIIKLNRIVKANDILISSTLRALSHAQHLQVQLLNSIK